MIETVHNHLLRMQINKWVHCEKETGINKLVSTDSGAPDNF